MVAEWISDGTVRGIKTEPPQFSDISVNQVLLAYVKYARTYYVRDGEITSEVENIAYSLRPVRKLYGRTPAMDFGPRRLKTVRDYMIDEEDLCRREINKRVGRIKRGGERGAGSAQRIPRARFGCWPTTGALSGS
ncbi:MAG: hypothetical protein DWQ31_08355 [Planctomycetota bacterium]|nr:MAG: hypothetical protein DWQ31_08355 [Planctomycetota bacterium]REJ93960.1 MAG: hypothetical protein DWQ35_09320 [Planctomycetota bacterium]REK30940.1 MAG: hypothetical protein DWQ42_01145 [Planctomycetota bacterium]REK38192.1 MAG: hypothetical protein DWQ46_20880 [Planctomycetota bacterium]